MGSYLMNNRNDVEVYKEKQTEYSKLLDLLKPKKRIGYMRRARKLGKYKRVGWRMAVRVRVLIKVSNREVYTSALLNSGFETEEPDIAIHVC